VCTASRPCDWRTYKHLPSFLTIIICLGSAFLVSCGTTSPGASMDGTTLTSISVTPASISVNTGLSQSFTATGTFSDGSMKDITASAGWSSSNNAFATIQTMGQSEPGLASGIAAGKATITATMDGMSGSAALTVSGNGGGAKLASITLQPATIAIAIGGTTQFDAMGLYSNGTNQDLTSSAVWTSSNPSDATIQSTGRANPGLAKGIAGGSVTITATMSGVTGTATLAVTSSTATITSISVNPVKPSIAAGVTQQFFATATYSDETTQDVTSVATWTSSNPSDATVQTTGQALPGLATGVAAGTVTVSAASGGSSGSTSLRMTSAGGNAAKIPLMDMTAKQNYLSFPGGLYENSSDTVPPSHDADGKSIAATIQPLDANGNPSASGRIVFASIGMSNAADEFGQFIGQAAASSSVNHTTLVLVNGAHGGITACYWVVPTGPPPCSVNTENQFDRVQEDVLTPLGVTEAQVQIVWLKEANGGPGVQGCGSSGGQPCQALCDPTVSGCSNTVTGTEALRYESQMGEILRAAKTRWPNLKLAFLSTRVYAGYAVVDINPEPYAYEYGYSAQWFIEAQINQIQTGTVDPTAGNLNYNDGMAPWIAWSAYIWANGDVPRSDGLIWCYGQSDAPCSGEVDFQDDGTHPNSEGQAKVASMLMNFFLNSPYTTGWFAAP
jgi:hypothetical protein